MRRLVPVLVALFAAGCGTTVHKAPPPPAPRHAAVPRPHRSAFPDVGYQRIELARLTATHQPIYCGGGRRRLVALTFDDGPGPYTGLALKELRRAHAHATFFLVGRSILRYPAWARREAHGAAVGDHTATHAMLTTLPRGQMVGEIADGRRAVERAAQVPVRLFRPPYGAFDSAVTREAARLGMLEILWSVDSGDSEGGNFHQISARVRRAVRPGAIVLFHENHGQTIRALRSLLPWLRRHHYRTASVPEMLAADPPTPAQLAQGSRACPSERAAFILGSGG